jgi:rhamnulokinase
MGLWLLEQCRLVWGRRGIEFDHVEMVQLTEDAPPLAAFFDPDDARLVDPPDLPEAIGELTGLDPNDSGAILRCVTDSLAMKSRYVLESIETAAGTTFSGLHVLGGGSRNAALCQAMANALGRSVWAGPAEATAIGNLLMQLLAAGEIASLVEGAALVADNAAIRMFEPAEAGRWQAAYEEYRAQLEQAVTA